MSEKKKVSIFSLYEKEKKLTLSDGEQSLDVVFVKMTQAELGEAMELYNHTLRKERELIKNDKTLYEEIKTLVDSFKKEELVEGVITVERVYREQYSDLYPIADEEKKTKEEKDKIIEEEIANWEKTRRDELSNEEKSKLVDRLVNLRVESLATMRASQALNNYSLSVMVRDVDTRERIFNTANDVLKVKDKNIINTLIETLNEFNKNMSDKNIREESQSPNFTPAGQSQEK